MSLALSRPVLAAIQSALASSQDERNSNLPGVGLEQLLLDLLGGHRGCSAAVPLVETRRRSAPVVGLLVPDALLLPALEGVDAVVAGVGLEALGEVADDVLGVSSAL
jgi:hypothetical protein